MKFLLQILLVVIGFNAFCQEEPAYKSLSEPVYHVGDKISCGKLQTLPVAGKYRKYTVELNADLANIRQFTFDHPQYEFIMVVVWKQLGRKFPSQTEAVTDSLEHFFRKPFHSGDNRQYLNMVDHIYVKKLVEPYMYLQVISDNSPLLAAKKNAIVGMDEPILYKHYSNIVKVDTSQIAESSVIYLELPGCYVQRKFHGTFLLKPRNFVKEKRIHVKSGITTQRLSHGVYWFELRKLPQPQIYLNEKEIVDSVATVSEIRKAIYTAKYADGKLKPNFIVAQVEYLIDGKLVKQTGDEVTKTVLKALKDKRDDEKIVIHRVIVNGSGRFKIKPGK